jgi:hypothetical protein
METGAVAGEMPRDGQMMLHELQPNPDALLQSCS